MDRMSRQAEAPTDRRPETAGAPGGEEPSTPSIRGYILVGPTAAGKSAVAQWIAERNQWAVLSADSMLVYRGMDIGTAKPTAGERRKVRYWGIDVVAPDCRFSAADFREEARRCVASLAPGEPLIVVGGTGLYLRVLLEGLADGAGPAPGLREKWRQVLEQSGIEALQEALRERSMSWYEALADPRNPRRLIRALERLEAGEQRPPETWKEGAAEPVVAGLTLPREALHRKIEARIHAMYHHGLIEEAAGLRQTCGELSDTALQAIGYREALSCLRGELSQEEAVRQTLVRTRHLAKRQMTWFRGQMSVAWVECEYDTSVETAGRRVMETWERVGAAPLRV